jgi:hypothetical protein
LQRARLHKSGSNPDSGGDHVAHSLRTSDRAHQLVIGSIVAFGDRSEQQRAERCGVSAITNLGAIG